jgi:hypothetical protein
MGVDILIGMAVGIVTLIGSILQIQNHIDKRFDAFAARLSETIARTQVDYVQFKGELEKHEYLINANKEAINHARQRFFEELSRLEADVKDLRSLTGEIQQRQTGTRVLPPPH